MLRNATFLGFSRALPGVSLKTSSNYITCTCVDPWIDTRGSILGTLGSCLGHGLRPKCNKKQELRGSARVANRPAKRLQLPYSGLPFSESTDCRGPWRECLALANIDGWRRADRQMFGSPECPESAGTSVHAL